MRVLGAADKPPPGHAPGPTAPFPGACEHDFLCADPGSDGVTWKAQGQRTTVTETSRAALSPPCRLRGSPRPWLVTELQTGSLQPPGPLERPRVLWGTVLTGGVPLRQQLSHKGVRRGARSVPYQRFPGCVSPQASPTSEAELRSWQRCGHSS